MPLAQGTQLGSAIRQESAVVARAAVDQRALPNMGAPEAR